MADATHKKSGKRTHQLIRVLDPNELVGEHLDMPGAAPSPIRNALALTICGALVVGLMASLIFSVDIYAVATAKVQPTGRSKILQAATAGRVSAVHVSNGSKVEEGQVLVELDATETDADHAIVLAGVQAKDAEIARRTAALRLAVAMPGGGPRRTEFSADAPADIMTREREVLKADLAQLSAGLAVLAALKRRLA